MAHTVQYDVLATGTVAADGSEVRNRGAVSASGAAGIYTLTLPGGGINAADCVIQVTPRTTADIAASVVHTSDTVKTVNTRTIAAVPAAAACAFDYVIARISNGAGR